MRCRRALFLLSLIPFALAGAALAADYTGAAWMATTHDAELKQLVVEHGRIHSPRSAQLRKVQVRVAASDAGRQVVTWCGEINTKNSTGSYTGFKPFYAVKGLASQPTVAVLSDDGNGNLLMGLMCKGSNLAG